MVPADFCQVSETFAVRAATFAVCDRKFPVPSVGNSFKQTSRFNGFERRGGKS